MPCISKRKGDRPSPQEAAPGKSIALFPVEWEPKTRILQASDWPPRRVALDGETLRHPSATGSDRSCLRSCSSDCADCVGAFLSRATASIMKGRNQPDRIFEAGSACAGPRTVDHDGVERAESVENTRSMVLSTCRNSRARRSSYAQPQPRDDSSAWGRTAVPFSRSDNGRFDWRSRRQLLGRIQVLPSRPQQGSELGRDPGKHAERELRPVQLDHPWFASKTRLRLRLGSERNGFRGSGFPGIAGLAVAGAAGGR